MYWDNYGDIIPDNQNIYDGNIDGLLLHMEKINIYWDIFTHTRRCLFTGYFNISDEDTE